MILVQKPCYQILGDGNDIRRRSIGMWPNICIELTQHIVDLQQDVWSLSPADAQYQQHKHNVNFDTSKLNHNPAHCLHVSSNLDSSVRLLLFCWNHRCQERKLQQNVCPSPLKLVEREHAPQQLAGLVMLLSIWQVVR